MRLKELLLILLGVKMWAFKGSCLLEMSTSVFTGDANSFKIKDNRGQIKRDGKM